MNSNLLFDFTVDKTTNTINVRREFDADTDLVWKAWTTSELLDQWWAPKPYRSLTKTMDFREGGYWLYAMVSPEDEKHWCRADYKTIAPLKSFSCLDAFCDENGNLNTSFPQTEWLLTFIDNTGTTTVDMLLKYASPEDLEKIVSMGFKEGFTMGLSNLDQLLAELKK